MRTPEIRPGIRRLFRLATRRDHAATKPTTRFAFICSCERTSSCAKECRPTPRAPKPSADSARSTRSARAFARGAPPRWTHARSRMDRQRAAGPSLRAAHAAARRRLHRRSRCSIVGLGIGASATVFSLVNGVLLRPMPFRDPSRLIWISNIADDGVAEWRLQVATISTSARGAARSTAWPATSPTIALATRRSQTHGETQRLTRVPVTCNFFPVPRRDAAPRPLVHGRRMPFGGVAATVLLTETMWRERFASDPSIVGRTLTINDAPVTVIGVLPASFDFASVFAPGTTVDLFAPFPLSEENNRQRQHARGRSDG